jgi:hypothetical protein
MNLESSPLLASMELPFPITMSFFLGSRLLNGYGKLKSVVVGMVDALPTPFG